MKTVYFVFFCCLFAPFFVHAQEVSLELEIVCETQNVCGQELWSGLAGSGKVDLYINDFINFEGDSLEVTITKNDFEDYIGVECPQIYHININADTIFSGNLSPSTELPLVSFITTWNNYLSSQLSLNFSYTINGEIITQSIDIFSLYEELEGTELYMPNCFEYISVDEIALNAGTAEYFYSLPDTFYYCNNQVINIDDYCGRILKSLYGFDGPYTEVQALVYLPEMDMMVGELSEVQFDNYENVVVKLYIYYYQENWWWGGEDETWLVEISEAPLVPLVLQENCMPPSIDLDLELVCEGQDYCGLEYWNRSDISVYLNSVNGNTNSDSVDLIILLPHLNDDHLNSVSNFESNTYPINEENYKSDTIFIGKVSPSQNLPLFSYSLAEYPTFHYFMSTAGEEAVFIVSDGENTATHKLLLSSKLNTEYNFKLDIPCSGAEKTDLYLIHNIDTLEYCSPEDLDFCMVYSPLGSQLGGNYIKLMVFEGAAPDYISELLYVDDHPTITNNFIPYGQLPLISKIENWAFESNNVKKVYAYRNTSEGYIKMDDFEPFHIKLSDEIYYEIMPAINICVHDDTYELPNGQNVYNDYLNSPEGNYLQAFLNIDGYLDTKESDNVCDSLFYTPITLNATPECFIDESSLPLETISIGSSALNLQSPSVYAYEFGYYNVDYTWLPNGETTNTINITEPGTYTLIISIEGYEDYIVEYVVIADCDFYANETTTETIETCTPITVNGINYFEEGTYENIQNLTNQYGCDSTVMQEVIILPNHETILEAVSACEGTAINGIFYNEAGTFEYIQNLTNQQGCDSVVSQVITIFEPPTVSINEGTDTIYQSVSAGEFVTISSTTNATEYTWLPNGETTPFIYATESGFYSVEVTNENGCTATASVYLNLDVISDISTLATEKIQLFPNPASNYCQLLNVPKSIEQIQVYNINGQIIADYKTPIETIDTENWNAGYYLIQFIGKNEQFTKPLIVE